MIKARGAADIDSDDKGEEMEEDAETDLDDEGEELEDCAESDSNQQPGPKRLRLEASPWPSSKLLYMYGALDDYFAKQDMGGPNFTYNYSMWSEEPVADMQYKALYDKLMGIPNFYEEVCRERNIFVEDCHCIPKAEEVADEDDQFCYMDIGCVITCLQDMRREHSLAKQLEKLREYEMFLLESHYWKTHPEGDDSARVELEDYKSYFFTGFSLADVKRDFESWIFELGSSGKMDDLRKRVEDDHINRLEISKGFMQTRARYIGKKFEHCRKVGIDFEASK